MKKLGLTLSLAALLLLSSCSKNGTPSPGGGKSNNGFPAGYDAGSIYYKAGGAGIMRFDLSARTVTNILPSWSDAGWDISWDGTMGVKEIDPVGFETVTHYILFNTADGSTIKDIEYQAPSGYAGSLPSFSPDGTRLMLRPTLNEGLIILDMDGNILHHVSGYGEGHEFNYLEAFNWMPDGTLLFKKDGGLWRTSADFSRATRIIDIPFDDWRGDCTASPDGTKIALSAGNHIWLMNADGSNFHAVTTSMQWEGAPSFSPDGKYMAIKANSRAPLEGDKGKSATSLCIIPADGQVYDVYPENDDRVIHPTEAGKSPSKEGLGMPMVWDFVWR